MKFFKNLLLTTVLLAKSSLVWTMVPKDVDSQIRKNFKSSLPSLQIESIRPSPIPRLYEVISGPVVMYVTEDGRYAISGDILNLLDGKTNLTEEARKKARIQAIDKLGEKQMIVFAAEKPKYQVTVFTDVDCVYCRKFHAQIDQYNKRGITVRYFAFPRTGKQSSSYEKATSVWCSEDPKAMFTNAMQGQSIPLAICETAKINEQFHLGALIGISGTPTIVLEDGSMVPGFYEPETLSRILKDTIKQPKTPA